MKIHWRWSKSGFRRLSIELFQKMFHFGVLEPFYDDLGKHDMKSLVRLYTKELRNNLAEALFTNSCMYVFYLRWQLMWKPISYMLPSLTVCRSENVFHFPFFLFSFPFFFFGPQNYEGGVVVWYKSALHLARKLVNRFSQTSVTFFSEYLRGSLWVQFSFGLSQFVLNPIRIILWTKVRQMNAEYHSWPTERALENFNPYKNDRGPIFPQNG